MGLVNRDDIIGPQWKSCVPQLPEYNTQWTVEYKQKQKKTDRGVGEIKKNQRKMRSELRRNDKAHTVFFIPENGTVMATFLVFGDFFTKYIFMILNIHYKEAPKACAVQSFEHKYCLRHFSSQ